MSALDPPPVGQDDRRHAVGDDLQVDDVPGDEVGAPVARAATQDLDQRVPVEPAFARPPERRERDPFDRQPRIAGRQLAR